MNTTASTECWLASWMGESKQEAEAEMQEVREDRDGFHWAKVG